MISTFTLLAAVSLAVVNAQTDPSMSTDSSMDMGGMATGGAMMPWMHFSLGDSLWFSTWVPQSKGALAGAAVGLFLLAIVDRWLASMRGVMEIYWRRRTEVMVAARFAPIADREKDSGTSESDIASLRNQTPPAVPLTGPRLANLRSIAPFVPAHDIVRGILHTGQAALTFAFMLAIMTFQGAFFIAIVIGLGVGEMLFGRFARMASHAH